MDPMAAQWVLLEFRERFIHIPDCLVHYILFYFYSYYLYLNIPHRFFYIIHHFCDCSLCDNNISVI